MYTHAYLYISTKMYLLFYLLLCNKLIQTEVLKTIHIHDLTVFVSQESGHSLTEFSVSGGFMRLPLRYSPGLGSYLKARLGRGPCLSSFI